MSISNYQAIVCSYMYSGDAQAQDFRIQYDSIVRLFLLPKNNTPHTLVRAPAPALAGAQVQSMQSSSSNSLRLRSQWAFSLVGVLRCSKGMRFLV